MTNGKPVPTYLKDYRPPAYLIDSTDLTFDLFEEYCIVTAKLACKANPDYPDPPAPFVCFGENLELLSLKLNDQPVPAEKFKLDAESLTIEDAERDFTLEVMTKILPQENKALEGLYRSGAIFCTQCEAEGFRHITYFPDKPDVLSIYSTRIIADERNYPVLLSNGNPIARGRLKDGRHWVRWSDPFKKPSYLFALVAGDLIAVEDTFTTASGKEVTLQIFVESHNADKCDHAMRSLKRSMRWDEEVYGREYDLDIFMIVAVDDFNAGAMENKGLNLFNSSLILAKAETATDQDFERIQGVVAHEYFHNWTGNRITCRDWFQLSLKEGLTIFRDQEFSADMASRSAKRISDVNFLRTAQFAEDAGPMAHQVRPDSYIEINNFYTVTIYHKGAELIRMMSILLGKQGFFQGMALYFDRHDGQAVTIEDFIKAMEDVNQADFSQFRLWYTQAGTPEVEMVREYNEEAQTLHLHFTQTCPPTPGQQEKSPFHIPITLGLLDSKGSPLFLGTDKHGEAVESVTLELKDAKHSFSFTDIPPKTTPSVFRNFSAPVKFHHDLTSDDLIFLMSHDSDAFNRWEAAQQLLSKAILNLVTAYRHKKWSEQELVSSIERDIQGIINAFRITLADTRLENEIISQTLTLPGELYLSDQMTVIDVDAIHTVREHLKNGLALALQPEFTTIYQTLHQTDNAGYDPPSAGIRNLKNLALEYLMAIGSNDIYDLCLEQFHSARTMTDEMKALTFIVNEDAGRRDEALNSFYQKWKNDTIVMNIWLMIQAASKITALPDIERLMGHPVFELHNPNKVRALIGVFTTSNLVNFHRDSGEGYTFLADQILKINILNPQIASRLLTPLTRWKRFDPVRQNAIKIQLERILKSPEISKDVYEITSKCLE